MSIEAMVTVKEAAKLWPCKPQNIRKKIKADTLPHEPDPNPPPHTKAQWLIPVSALPDKAQKRYYGSMKGKVTPFLPLARQMLQGLENYSEDQRAEIAYWCDLIDEWQHYRSNPDIKNKTELDEQFILFKQMQGVELTAATLYRRWKAVKEGDIAALVDKRGDALRGQSSIPDKVFDAFLWFYLDERQLSIQKSHELTRYWVREYYPELEPTLPKYHAFYRRVKQIEKPTLVYRREGRKSYDDHCAPYIERLYDEVNANDYWIGDNHTLDIRSRATPDSPPHRLHVTAFIDAVSGIFTGINVTLNPCSDSTRLALRNGILRFGTPDNAYLDNGSEFLTHDIGGRGHRTKRKYRDEEAPPTIFRLLGINMVNALVRNAKAKPIERTFGTLKGTFSRLWDTYCGGNVMERPEKLKHVEKSGDFPLDSEVAALLEDMCFGYYNNQPYTGKVERFKGMTRLEVFKETLHNQRTSTLENLNLLLMRHSRLQKVGRRGVHITVAGQKLDYWNDDLLAMQSDNSDKRVYVRYDPDDLSYVHVYDKDDRFIMTVPLDTACRLKFGDSKERVAEANRAIRASKRAAIEKATSYGQLDPEERISALALMAKVAASQNTGEPVRGKVISPIRPDPDSVPKKAKTADVSYVEIDEARMNRNIELRKKGVG